MRYLFAIIILCTVFSSCDCVQKASGVVFDKETRLPIARVALGKYAKEDTANSYSHRVYSNNQGNFEYRFTSGGFRKCPDLILFFSKEGYLPQKINFDSYSQNDTVYLEKVIPIESKKDSIERTNNASVITSGSDITKAYIYFHEGDTLIGLTANIRKDHRIFGYAKPDLNSDKLLLLSVFTNDVEGNPFGCRLGAYYDTNGMSGIRIKFSGVTGDFVKATVVDRMNNETIIYFDKKWINLEK